MSDSDEDFASADEGELDASVDVSDKGKKQKAQSVKPHGTEAGKSVKHERASGGDGVLISSESARLKQGEVSDRQKRTQTDVKPDKSEIGENAAKGETKQQQQTGKGKKGKKKGGQGKNAGGSKEDSCKTSDNFDEGETGKEPEGEIGGAKNGDTDDMKENSASGLQDSSYDTEAKDTAVNKEKTPEKGEETQAKMNSDKENTQEMKIDSTEQSEPVEKDTPKTPAKDKQGDSGKTAEQNPAMLKSPSSQDISRPEPDHTDKQEEVLERLAESAKEKKGGWGWGWGSSLLEAASTSVSTFSHQVGEGFHTMIETVESALDIPDPEELALRRTAGKEAKCEEDDDDQEESKEEKKEHTGSEEQEESADDDKKNQTVEGGDQSSQAKTDTQSKGGWFSGWGVSSITKTLGTTSKNLVSGSLDVLESIGKKTFDVINEHDPGLKKARAFLHDRGDKPNLSTVLRDAKDQYEEKMRQEKESEEARKAHFGSLFDEFQGLAHLEALEMLSNQSEKSVNTLLHAIPPEAISKLKPLLLQIKQNFEIDDDDDDEEDVSEQEFELLVTDLMKQLNIGTSADKLVQTHSAIVKVLKRYEDDSKTDIKDMHQVAISSMAEFTSKCIEQFHKTGELILIQKSPVPDFKECSSVLHRFTKVLTAEVGIMSTKFSDCLNKHEGDGEIKVNHLVTNIYLEASNSSSYIQDGFRLLLPVLQQAAIESTQELDS